METPLATDAPAAVETLTRRRAQLQDWLGRLGEVGSGVPGHVTDRVRRDYEDRLRSVTQELSEHRDALTAELHDRRAELEEADARRAAAADDLEEARLRHLIGELAEGDWESRRPELETALAAAETQASGVRAEVERLDALLGEMPGAAPAQPAGAAAPEPAAAAPAASPSGETEQPEWMSEPATEPEPAAAPEGFLPPRDTSDDTIPEFTPFAQDDRTGAAAADDDLGVDLSWLEDVEQVSTTVDLSGGAAAGAPADEEDSSADDLAFLEELDRAISASPAAGQAGSPSAAAPDPDRTLDPDRAGMLLCKECGAINEPQLWYCEICGSEL
ncbi:MAG TPA: Ran-binding zinc finger domain-containing protein [Longimicrobiaceae bacterium]|nr:Ran-binding zinc finger domain-containing protein [Longimicrobiaceae bacterium]